MSEFAASYPTYVGVHFTRAKLQTFALDIQAEDATINSCICGI